LAGLFLTAVNNNQINDIFSLEEEPKDVPYKSVVPNMEFLSHKMFERNPRH
ncbi:hypothetical protein KI387_001347, partial [Taxus chinensis]